MDTQELKRALEQLHRELSSGAAVDPQLREIIKTLDSDIHSALQQPAGTNGNAPAAESELSERARSVSARFAADHPYLESALRDLMDALAKMGI